MAPSLPLLLLFFLSASSGTAALSPLALFSRCYAHLTQKKLPLNHSHRTPVINGTVSPTAACLSILDKAKVHPTSSDEGKLIRSDPEALAVLRAMNDHHRTWFPNDDLVVSTPQCGERCPRAAQIHDSAEAALHLTRVLLTDNARFSEIVTGDSAMEALRSQGPVENKSQIPELLFKTNSTSLGFDNTPVPLDGELPQLGALIGLRRLKLNSRKANMLARTNTGLDRIKEFSIHRSIGGGVLGTKSYMLLNLGRPDTSTMDGGLVMPRRWSKSIFSEFLCREVPVIRVGDADPFVQHSSKPNTPPFRTSKNCMQCHASMDPLAAVARNVVYTYIPGLDSNSGPKHTTPQIYEFDVDQPRESGQVDQDHLFHRRPPNGRFYFRTYTGELINSPVHGTAALGNLLAALDDFYICTASRYVHFFTGISVNFQDPGDPTSTPPTENERRHQEKVIQLGLHLKSHQSLRELVREILESPIYQAPFSNNTATQ